MPALKQLLLSSGKSIGLFALSRYLTRRRLRVLCYHGFALDDEYQFRPGMFIEADRFQRRLRYLFEKRFPVLSLGDALERLEVGTLPSRATVITIDDGFYST
ncbi:MAG TPA: hypothetical protein VKE70_36250 [Candidatus Solibacter sp.]|nr:hypothetical protein [Candidatus Solibacter sp.]